MTSFLGVFSNHSDLAPNFSGTLMAVTNTVATLPGVLIPPVVGLMKYVPFWLVVESQVSVKLQQTPNPWAQPPSATPPWEEHSFFVKQVPKETK